MTLERVIVDLYDSFEPSQIYVARKLGPLVSALLQLTITIVSRAKSLRGLRVVRLPKEDLGGANPQVKEFYETFIRNRSSQ